MVTEACAYSNIEEPIPAVAEQMLIAVEGRKKKAQNDSSQVEEDPIIREIVDEMNKKFAVLEQPTFLVLEENEDGTFSLDKKQSFKDRFQNKQIEIGDQRRSKAEIFLESPRRRTFRKITMNPHCVGHFEQKGIWFYNLWNGFSFVPKEGSCERYKQHVLEVICSGKRDRYEFLMNLLATWIQRPQERTVAILLRGPQGCGKNCFVDPIGKLFGHAYGVYDDVERLLGRFNSELATKLLIFADEALWGGRKSDSGKLKAAITGDKLWIEQKGKDKIEIPNYRKFVAASNERFALPLDSDDRRWLVLECGGTRVGDRDYFTGIVEELENDGYAALLYELLHRDISDFKPRILPANDDAFDLKLQCAPSFIQYMFAALDEGRMDLESSGGFLWTEEGLTIRNDVLRTHYKAFCYKEKLQLQSDKECGWLLKNLFEGAGLKKFRKRYAGTRYPTYAFPPFSVGRERLAHHFHITDQAVLFPKEEEEE
jgi:hypothetical protein